MNLIDKNGCRKHGSVFIPVCFVDYCRGQPTPEKIIADETGSAAAEVTVFNLVNNEVIDEGKIVYVCNA